MSSITTNYALVKPEQDEFYNVTVPNGNMDIIDTELKRLSDGLGSVPGEFATLLRGWKSGLAIEFVDSLNVKITPGSIHIKNGDSESVITKSDESIVPIGSGAAWTILTINSAGVIQSYVDVIGLRPTASCFNNGDELLGYYFAEGERVIGAAARTSDPSSIINLGCHLEETGRNDTGYWQRYTNGRLVVWGSLKITSITWTANGSLYNSQEINLMFPQAFVDEVKKLIQTITCRMSTGSVLWAAGSKHVALYTPGAPVTDTKVRVVASSNTDSSETYINFVIRGHWR